MIRVMTEKLCVVCHAAPVNIAPSGPESYCKPCRNTRQRKRAAKYRQTTGPKTCPKCGTIHERQGSDNWCKTCRAAYHRARRADPAKTEHIKTRQREWYAANRDRERALRRKYSEQAKREAIDAYGGICACCGEEHLEFLTIDHINGGGREHRKQSGAVGKYFYIWLRKQGYPQGELRVLCFNCNCSYGFYGYCPHERERERAVGAPS